MARAVVVPPAGAAAVSDPLRDQLQISLGTAYTLERELGRGGMSRVFLARDEALGREVVVKVLSLELAAGLSAERFAREIRLAAALQEPHIVPVHTSGVTTEGLPYYTMPYVSGESLRARLARGPVPLTEARSILHDVATALEYAHAHGLVHRDIKPENVLLSGRTAVVTDFGIAKALSVSSTHAPVGPAVGTLTQLGTSLGTPAYMAPEQAAADPATDHRADLYAWGVMAYELLAGRHPFAAHTSPHALMAAHFLETPALLPRSVPPALAALVARCLAKDPAHRLASSNELLAALDAAVTSGEGPISSAVLPRRRRAALLALGLIALALFAGGAWVWRTRVRAAPGAPDAPPLLAVLAFESIAGTAGAVPDTAFADGLRDAITGKLARLQGLRVIDRASVRTVDDAARRPQATGRTLGADYVLRATLRWARGADGVPRVQVSPVLVRVVDGTTKWAGEPTVVVPSDPFAAQGTLATAVAVALDIALAPAERAGLARPPTTDTAAFAAVQRGRRLWVRALRGTQQEQVQALREYERAYQRDPQYADALGLAALVLDQMAQTGAPRALYDSAAVLAHRALALDPGQPDAVFALAVVDAKSRGRPDEATQLIEQAAQAYPSSADLQTLLASTRIQVAGDSAGAVDAAARAVALGPRSEEVIFEVIRVMLALRRYDDARDLIARGRALEPESPAMPLMAVELASAVGDTAAVSSAMRELRAAGAGRGVEMLDKMRVGDAALRQEVAAVSLALVGAATARDSILYYRAKVQVFLTRGETSRARALMDSGARVSAARAAAYSADSVNAASMFRRVAWFAAGRGDRPAAVAALRRGAADPLIRGRPGNLWDADQTCTSAEVYGLLGDAEGMLPFLRRCLTMLNGYHLARLGEPAFARVRTDPRVRALTAEIAAAQARARRSAARDAS